MGLDIWLKDDIANILQAADDANLSAMLAGDYGSAIGGSGEAGRELRRVYRHGFVAALATLAQALSLPVAQTDRELAGAASEARLGSSDGSLALPAVKVGGQQCEK